MHNKQNIYAWQHKVTKKIVKKYNTTLDFDNACCYIDVVKKP